MSSENPLVSVLVLNYNGRRFLDDCFQSLEQTSYPNAKIWLIDNGSTEDDVAYVSEKYPWVHIHAIKDNCGYSGAYNDAMKACDGKYQVLLNNDVKVHPDWLNDMVTLAESDYKIGALQPRLNHMVNKGHFEHAGGSGGKMDKYGYPFLRGRVFSHVEEDKGQYMDVDNIFWASGACFFIRRSVIDETGNLDHVFRHHMEEIDLCWRIWLQGYTIKVVPTGFIEHFDGGTIRHESYIKKYWNHRNSIFMLIKNYSWWTLVKILPLRILLDWASIPWALLTKDYPRARAIITAHFWLVFHPRVMFKHRREVQKRRIVSDKEMMKILYPKCLPVQCFAKRRTTYTELMKVV